MGKVRRTVPRRIAAWRRRQSFHSGPHLKNMGMPGHLGDERVTVQNLQVMQVREAEKVILISGAVPGCNGVMWSLGRRLRIPQLR